jgi:hypothetical protein
MRQPYNRATILEAIDMSESKRRRPGKREREAFKAAHGASFSESQKERQKAAQKAQPQK